MSEKKPVVNITIPVFNRFHSTQKTILGLYKSSQVVPFSVTVVDNGSEPELVERLIEFKKDGIIDNLFLLPHNMGIATAANIGWRMVDAPFYMKLDNDTVMKDPLWLDKLFKLWQHGDPLSNLGGAYDYAMLVEVPDAVQTPNGILGKCISNLPGQAILIPRGVSDVLGMWNEDYGLYGAEDGDYGLRMQCVDLPQYYYLGTDYFDDLGKEDIIKEYDERKIDRKWQVKNVFIEAGGGLGLYFINYFLYFMCIRSWRVPQRFSIADVTHDHKVVLSLEKGYKEYRCALLECQKKLNVLHHAGRMNEAYSEEFTQELKSIMADCGHGYDDMVKKVTQHSPQITRHKNVIPEVIQQELSKQSL